MKLMCGLVEGDKELSYNLSVLYCVFRTNEVTQVIYNEMKVYFFFFLVLCAVDSNVYVISEKITISTKFSITT